MKNTWTTSHLLPWRDFGWQAAEQVRASRLFLWMTLTIWIRYATEPIKVGKASPTEGTLPGSIYLIVKYQGEFKAAAVANAMIGGDNASRAIAIGLVMGAHQGMSAIPDNLGEGHLVEFDRVNKLIDKLPLIAKQSKSEL